MKGSKTPVNILVFVGAGGQCFSISLSKKFYELVFGTLGRGVESKNILSQLKDL